MYLSNQSAVENDLFATSKWLFIKTIPLYIHIIL